MSIESFWSKRNSTVSDELFHFPKHELPDRLVNISATRCFFCPMIGSPLITWLSVSFCSFNFWFLGKMYQWRAGNRTFRFRMPRSERSFHNFACRFLCLRLRIRDWMIRHTQVTLMQNCIWFMEEFEVAHVQLLQASQDFWSCDQNLKEVSHKEQSSYQSNCRRRAVKQERTGGHPLVEHRRRHKSGSDGLIFLCDLHLFCLRSMFSNEIWGALNTIHLIGFAPTQLMTRLTNSYVPIKQGSVRDVVNIWRISLASTLVLSSKFRLAGGFSCVRQYESVERGDKARKYWFFFSLVSFAYR